MHLSRRTDATASPKQLTPFHPEHLALNHNNWPNLRGDVEYDSKILYERRLRRWSFCWVYGKERAASGENQAAFTSNIAAIDPGVVNFITWYSPQLGAGHIGHRDINKIIRLCLRLDRLISATTSAPGRRKSSHRRAQARLRKRIRNLVDEIHRKTIRFLVETFDIIVIPKFGATQMSLRKPGRRLAKKTVRGMLGWAHGRFRVALINKAEEVGVTVVTDFSEAYTSRTCSSCGWEHPRLGGRREFICGGCGLIIDRDINGAKGVLLRSVREGRLVAKIHS
jgi:putative transposase